MPQLQYQRLAEPIPWQADLSEVITLDKWFNQQPCIAPRRAVYREPGERWAEPCEALFVIPTMDKWFQEPPLPVRNRTFVNEVKYVYPLVPSLVTIPTLDMWVGFEQPVPRRPVQRYPGDRWSLTENSLQVTPSLDKWQPSIPPMPVRRKLHRQEDSRVCITYPPLFVHPQLEWMVQQPDMTRRKGFRNSGSATAITEPTLYVTPLMSTWYEQQADRMVRKVVKQPGEQRSITEPTMFVIPVMSQWFDQQVDVNRRVVSKQPGDSRSITEPTFYVTPLMDTWFQQQADVVRLSKLWHTRFVQTERNAEQAVTHGNYFVVAGGFVV